MSKRELRKRKSGSLAAAYKNPQVSPETIVVGTRLRVKENLRNFGKGSEWGRAQGLSSGLKPK